MSDRYQLPFPVRLDGKLDTERLLGEPAALVRFTTHVAKAMVASVLLVSVAFALTTTELAASLRWWTLLPAAVAAVAVSWAARRRFFARDNTEFPIRFERAVHRVRPATEQRPMTPLERWRVGNTWCVFGVAGIAAVGIVTGLLAEAPWPTGFGAAAAVVVQLTACWPPRTWRRCNS